MVTGHRLLSTISTFRRPADESWPILGPRSTAFSPFFWHCFGRLPAIKQYNTVFASHISLIQFGHLFVTVWYPKFSFISASHYPSSTNSRRRNKSVREARVHSTHLLTRIETLLRARLVRHLTAQHDADKAATVRGGAGRRAGRRIVLSLRGEVEDGK